MDTDFFHSPNFKFPKLFTCPWKISFISRKLDTISTTCDLKSSIHLYRCLDLLEKSINAFLMHRVLPIIVFCVPGIQIISQYITINYHDHITMPGFLVFPVLAANAAISSMLLLTLASYVHTNSDKLLHVLASRSEGRISGKSGKTIKRGIKSLKPMKIRFGSNFIDQQTPIVIQTFCINQTVSLTLIMSM